MSSSDRSSKTRRAYCRRRKLSRICAAAALWLAVLCGPPNALHSAALRTSQAQANTSTGAGPQETRPLQPGAVVRSLLGGGESHLYRISVGSGQFLRCVVNQQGIDVVLTLTAEGGEQLIRANNANGTQGQEIVSTVSETGGAYLLKVSPRQATPKPGYYEVSVAVLRPAMAEDDKRVAAERAISKGEEYLADETEQGCTQALNEYREALRLWQELNDPAGQALARLDIGKAYYYLARMTEAAEEYEGASNLFRAAGRHLDDGVARLDLGMARLALGDNDAAFSLYEQALQIFTDESDERYEAFALNELGRTYFLRGDFNSAIEYYGRALPIRHALNDLRSEAFTLLAQGRVYDDGFGDDARALELYNQALQLLEGVKNGNRLAAQTLGDIGRVHFKAGDYATALDKYNEALRRAEGGDPTVRAELLTYAGMAHSAQGHQREAIEQYFSVALPLQRQAKDAVGEARTLQEMGLAYSALGEQESALTRLKEAQELWHKAAYVTAEAATRYSIALVETRREHFAEACEQLRAALPTVEALRTQTANEFLRASYFSSVQKYYELYIDALMRRARQTQDKQFEALAVSVSENRRARALLDTLLEARADLRQSVAAPELLTREARLQQQLNALSLAEVLGVSRAPEQAALARKRLDDLITQYHDLEAEIRRKNPRYAALVHPSPPTLEEIQREVLAPDQTLLEYSLGEERSYLWVITSRDVSSFVLPKRAEIAAAVGQVRSLLVARNEANPDETDSAREARIRQADAHYRAAAAALGRMLKLDQGAQLLKTERLLIVGDGELQDIPFSALLVPARDDASARRYADESGDGLLPLLAYHEIETPPSASLLAELKRERVTGAQAPPRNLIAIIADPVFSPSDDRCCKAPPGLKRGRPAGERRAAQSPVPPRAAGEAELPGRQLGLTDSRGHFSRLSFTWYEAENIAAELRKSVPPTQWMRADGFKANRALVTDGSQLASYRILHFATHGFADREHPELSGLLLSLVDERGQPQNGFLQMLQIYNLHLPAELVVLSACETGVGKSFGGEGVYGLARGFIYAGARRVIASLWRVQDASTSELMVYFYQNLQLANNADLRRVRPAAALRAAQLKLLEQPCCRQPYFWAGFTIQGESN